ncbi:DUF6924 domain-containing protein [Aeromicrobium choanae]|uniref:DUF6924 domain-containing protein n=1 Tax=Aeromicrobium choanae TaxID=1736691 RepID=A0A1T4YN85_9ACTN|nr:hypothetical protein [Aeromicrobium choanae]SKB03180.1 hypothetical protein SAMN06295964_0173 [Aeromicrobium choanae]
MFEFPEGATPLVRTWFGDHAAWQAVLAEVVTRAQERDEFAYVETVDDPTLATLSLAELAALHPSPTGLSLVIVADQHAMTESGLPLLLLRADGTVPPEQMRVEAEHVAIVEINVAQLANLDWEDFAGRVDPDGVFRGFR